MEIMKDLNLFKSPEGFWITSSQILSALEKVKAADAKVLYMHTSMTFGAPNIELGRQDLLAHLYDLIAALGVPTLLIPTYTFSFCNGEDYNVQASRSKMGALNEYIRKMPCALRSIDPLMSSVLIGQDRDLVENLGNNSIGANSTFDKIHRCGSDVRFLFFGATASDCYTYTHYVEKRLNTPYRYNRDFTGNITDGDRTWEDTYTLFVRYKDVVPNTDGLLEKTLIARGLMRKVSCGGSSISCLTEPAGYETIVEQIKENGLAYITNDPGDRNTEFFVRNMVAL